MLCFLVLLITVTTTHAATAIVNTTNDGDILLGFDGVRVIGTGGGDYNVRFIDGVYTDIFAGPQFAYLLGIAMAENALLSAFDEYESWDNHTQGVPVGISKQHQYSDWKFYTPFYDFGGNFIMATVDNPHAGLGYLESPGQILTLNESYDTSENQQVTYAKWTLAPVPLPAAFWLFSSGLFGLIGYSRHKK